MKIAHIVNTRPPASALKEALKELQIREQNDVFYNDNTLSIGPLFEIETEHGAKKRQEYFKTLYNNLDFDYPFENLITVNDFLAYDFSEYDKVIIWHGTSASEIILKALCCYHIDAELHAIDVSKLKSKNGYPLVKVNECDIAKLKSLLGKEELISASQKENYKQLWLATSQKKEQFRIYDNHKLIEVSEDYYDDFILSKVTKDWQRAMKIVGAAMGWNLQLTDYFFTSNRIISLIKQGKLIVKDNLLPIHEAYVKLTD